MKRILIFFCILGFSVNLFSSTIRGKNKSYAGKELVFFLQENPITGKDKIIGKVIVEAEGFFSVDIKIQETSIVYAFLGIYKIYIFTEPDHSYEVVLPAYQDKTKADFLNPYFEPVDVQLGTIVFNENDLNVQIRMFNDAYEPYYNKHINKVFTTKDFDQLDKDIGKMDKPFQKNENIFFENYRKYKYGMLRFLAYQHKSKSISDNYFKDKPFLYHNPAYLELFNMVYTSYFSYFSRADDKNLLYKAIDDGDYKKLKAVLSKDEVLQPNELLNMVILKSIHDEFYDDNYSRTKLLSVLDSFIDQNKDLVQVELAKNIRHKVTLLLKGFEPPKFELYDTDSNLVSLNNFYGKHIYLNFCTCFSYTCLNEFAMLKTLYNKHKEYMEIVTVIIGDDVSVMKDFISRSGYEWTFLHYDNQPGVIEDYDLRTFPTYYLIDDEGKLVASPAPSPRDNFEVLLYKELKAKGKLEVKSDWESDPF